jgi:hypothetical protein
VPVAEKRPDQGVAARVISLLTTAATFSRKLAVGRGTRRAAPFSPEVVADKAGIHVAAIAIERLMSHARVLWILTSVSALHVVEEHGFRWQAWAVSTLGPNSASGCRSPGSG